MDVMLGPYRVTGTIGRGGMGIVYAAEHALLGRPAAIKVLLSELSQKQDVVQRFFNEARAATAIRHPGIIEIYELCCGRPPFRGEGPGDVLAAHIHTPVPAMSRARTEIPASVEMLVRRLLAKAPGDRLQTAEEVIFAIDAVNCERTITMAGPP